MNETTGLFRGTTHKGYGHSRDYESADRPQHEHLLVWECHFRPHVFVAVPLSGSRFHGHHLTVFFTETEGRYGRTEAVLPRVQARGGEAGDGAWGDPGASGAGPRCACDCAPRLGAGVARR